jgi:hypothetical protein
MNVINLITRITLIFVFVLGVVSSASAISSVNVPLDSWVYPALDNLEAFGLIDTALSGTKPYSRLEVARQVKEAMKKWEDFLARGKASNYAEKELIPSLLERLKNKFKPELIEWGALEGTPASSFLKPVDEIILKSGYQTDNPVVRPQTGQPSTHTIYPIYNNDGIVYEKHYNASVELTGEGRLWNHLSFYYQPILTMFDGQGAQVRLEKGYVKAEGFNIEVEVGRDSLWWGPGRHGALLMTNNARPFDVIKFSNPQPVLLPFLGPFKATVFFSQLDYGQPYIEKPTLHGLRLNFKPLPILEFGISQVAIFDGEGRKSLSASDYFNILYGNSNKDNTKLDSNKQVAIDFSLRWPDLYKFLPMARSLKFYGEWGAEDTGSPPDRRAFLLGLSLYDLFLTGRVDLRLEYTNTASQLSLENSSTSTNQVPSAWYTHSSYPPIFHERIFGHHVGSNGDDFFARLTGYLSPKLTLGLDFDFETQGKVNAIKTRSYQWGIDADYWIRDRIKVRGRYILENFRDSQSIAGGDKTHHLFGIELRYGF